MLNIFSCAYWPSVCLPWKNVYFTHFFTGFFFVRELYDCLYILDVNPLLIISFESIFSHSVGCIFGYFLCCAKVSKVN